MDLIHKADRNNRGPRPLWWVRKRQTGKKKGKRPRGGEAIKSQGRGHVVHPALRGKGSDRDSTRHRQEKGGKKKKEKEISGGL